MEDVCYKNPLCYIAETTYFVESCVVDKELNVRGKVKWLNKKR